MGRRSLQRTILLAILSFGAAPAAHASDRTAEILSKYAEDIDLYVASERHGKTYGMNLLSARAQADILIFDEPTRGIDVGAKAEVHDLIREEAGKEALRRERAHQPGLERSELVELRQKAKKFGFWGLSTPEEYGALIKREVEKYTALGKTLKLKMD